MSGERKLTFGKRRGERGADVLEAALVLPILLTLLLALYSFGRGWNIYETMTRAAREGVRHAVTTSCAMCGNSYTPATGSGSVQSDFVFPALKAAGIDTNNSLLQSTYHQGTVVLDQAGKVCGAYIKFSYPYKLQIPFIAWTLTTITLKTKVQMRYENMPATCTPS